MNSRRFFLLLTLGLGLLACSSIASSYYGYQMLKDKSSELRDVKINRLALEKQERSLVEASKEVQQYSALGDVAKSIVPQEKDQARTVREIVAIAQESSVNIAGISFPSSTLGEAKGASGTATQLDKVEGIAGLSQLEINVNIDNLVDYPTLINFLKRLEQNRRTSAISSIVINPNTDPDSGASLLNFGLTILVYIKP